ncbi:recombinase family protein [Anaerotruncus colihominis]|uniref:Recombinase family protein n=1 Tax=Anaerotruncus colihominis TaxID=169435 RepID=A0A845RHT7_9FIRM|nr:recombinase family protein [Anaerotruncus colihominis]NBI78395.1 recombinase family protein [Anaerotruncus colihominis]
MIFIYSRKSVYTGKGESIENQVELCRRYIDDRIRGGRDAEIAVYEDEGFSGKNLDRPQFQRMLADSKIQKPDYIVCYRLDRISRSVGDFAPLVEDFIARDIGFVCIKEQFDTSTPMGKAMMYIASVFAQLERETIAERVKDNMTLLARTGRWLGGVTPTGFISEQVENDASDGRKKTIHQLTPNPAEVGTVQLIFQKYLELRSLRGVSKYLMRAGVRNRSGEPYSMLGIKDLLRNPVYCTADSAARAYFLAEGAQVCFFEWECSKEHGLLSYNKRQYVHKGRSRLEKSQWIVAIGGHPGMIDSVDWIAVQKLLEEHSKQNRLKLPQSYNDYAILSGQIFCASCHSRMFAKRRSNSETLFDYICKSKLKAGGSCGCRNLNGSRTDQLVYSYLLQSIQGDRKLYRLLDDLKKHIQEQAAPDTAAYLDRQLAKTQREIDGLLAVLASNAANEAVIRQVNAQIERLEMESERLRISRELAKQASQEGDKADIERALYLSKQLLDVKDCFSLATIHEKRDLIRFFVNRLEWDGTDLHVFLYEREGIQSMETAVQIVSNPRGKLSQR